MTIENCIALLSLILLAVREVLFEQRRQDLGSELRFFYLRFWCVCVRVCVCMCVCEGEREGVRERERDRERVCVREV